MIPFKTNANEDYYKPKQVNNVYRGEEKPRKPKTQKGKNEKQSEHNIINDVTNIFKLKKKNEAIKDRIIRDIRNLFELPEAKVVTSQ